MEDWLFTNNATLTPASVRQAARGHWRGHRFRRAVPDDHGPGEERHCAGDHPRIKVTPTFFVNGVRLEGGLPPQYFEMALQMELKKAGKTP